MGGSDPHKSHRHEDEDEQESAGVAIAIGGKVGYVLFGFVMRGTLAWVLLQVGVHLEAVWWNFICESCLFGLGWCTAENTFHASIGSK